MKLQTMYQIYGTITVLLSSLVFPDSVIWKTLMIASFIIYILIPRKWWESWND